MATSGAGPESNESLAPRKHHDFEASCQQLMGPERPRKEGAAGLLFNPCLKRGGRRNPAIRGLVLKITHESISSTKKQPSHNSGVALESIIANLIGKGGVDPSPL